MAIDLSTQNLQQLCAVLNEFALPRVIVDFERHSFVAWNPRFLEHTGFSEDEIKASQAEELLTFGESWFPLSDEREGQTVEYIACAARRPFGADPAPGFAVRSHGKIGYVMLDVFDSSSAKFEQGRNAGRDEERNRVIKTFHEVHSIAYTQTRADFAPFAVKSRSSSEAFSSGSGIKCKVILQRNRGICI